MLFLDILRRNRIALPPSLLLVFRTLASLEGTLRKLVPDYDMVARALHVAPRIGRSLFSPQQAALSAQTWAALLAEQTLRLPRRLENITRSLDDGTLSVRIRALDSASDRGWAESVAARFTTTAIGIALVIAGVLLTSDDGGPMLTSDVPAFSLLGSLVGLGGVLLVLRSLRTALRSRS